MQQKQISKIFHTLMLQVLHWSLANIKTEIDKLDIDKSVPVPVDLSNVVKNQVVRKTVHDKLIAKENNIDTSRFDLKTKYNADKTELERKFLTLVDLLKNQIIMLKLVKQKINYRVLVV